MESLLGLVTAILIEISETWKTGQAYLNLNTQTENAKYQKLEA